MGSTSSSGVAKAAGWLQFVGQILGQVVQNGVPHNAVQWATTLGSLLAAIGIHASSNVPSQPQSGE